MCTHMYRSQIYIGCGNQVCIVECTFHLSHSGTWPVNLKFSIPKLIICISTFRHPPIEDKMVQLHEDRKREQEC